jgi:pilus assembly protein Flp/PilA
MRTLVDRLRALRENRTAVTALEYALIASLISILIISGTTAIGTRTSALYQTVATHL